jgi:ADP-ribose pyrophosphatase YjhB (NUDIX family)
LECRGLVHWWSIVGKRGIVEPEDLIDESEIAALEQRFGPLLRRDYRLGPGEWGTDFWNDIISGRKNRRGEVVLAIRRPGGRVLLHTKSFYPPGVYRLPSGGIHWGEPVLDALSREAVEETGLKASLERCLGIIAYQFDREREDLLFVSYVFLLGAFRGRPASQDPGERISAFRSVPLSALRQTAQALRSLPPSWADWGRFRALAHDLAADALGI